MEEEGELHFQTSYIQHNSWTMKEEGEHERGGEATFSDFLHLTQQLEHE
jgi:hypothetical protein